MVQVKIPGIKALLRILISGGILASAWLIVDMISSSPAASAAEVNEVTAASPVDVPPVIPSALPPVLLPVAAIENAAILPTPLAPVAGVITEVPDVAALPVVGDVLQSIPLVSSVLHTALSLASVPLAGEIGTFAQASDSAPVLLPTEPLRPVAPEPTNGAGTYNGGSAGDREITAASLRPLVGAQPANRTDVLPNSFTFDTDTTPD